MPDCVIVQEICKRAGERIAFPPFELVDRLARSWEPEQPFAVSVAVRPKGRRSTGLEYVSSGGVTGEREPKWPAVAGGTISEGPITWTAQLISNASLIYRIESRTYDVPDGITNHEQSFIDEPGSQQVPMEVSGGTIGKTYDVVAKVQMTAVGSSVPLYELVLRVTIE
jgi:hypothetical protein